MADQPKRQPISKGLRYAIFERDGFTCQYCGRKAPDVELEVDHLIPASAGGETGPSNLIAACKACNTGKAAKLPPTEQVSDEKLKSNLKALADRRETLYATLCEEQSIKQLWKDRVWELIGYWQEGLGIKEEDDEPKTTARRFFNMVSAMLVRHGFELVLKGMSITLGRFVSPDKELQATKYFCGVMRNLGHMREDAPEQVIP